MILHTCRCKLVQQRCVRRQDSSPAARRSRCTVARGMLKSPLILKRVGPAEPVDFCLPGSVMRKVRPGELALTPCCSSCQLRRHLWRQPSGIVSAVTAVPPLRQVDLGI